MDTIPLGGSRLAVRVLCLGCMNFGTRVDQATSFRLLAAKHRAWHVGFSRWQRRPVEGTGSVPASAVIGPRRSGPAAPDSRRETLGSAWRADTTGRRRTRPTANRRPRGRRALAPVRELSGAPTGSTRPLADAERRLVVAVKLGISEGEAHGASTVRLLKLHGSSSDEAKDWQILDFDQLHVMGHEADAAAATHAPFADRRAMVPTSRPFRAPDLEPQPVLALRLVRAAGREHRPRGRGPRAVV